MVMALRLLLCVALLGPFSGCFNPRVKNFGFACNANDVLPCPAGFQCRNGYCDDGSGGSPPGGGTSTDMSMSVATTSDMSQPQSRDMAQPVADMTQSIPDLANGPDMTQVTCQVVGAPCQSHVDCCSGHCHTVISPHTCF
jgi:hypothetical protein